MSTHPPATAPAQSEPERAAPRTPRRLALAALRTARPHQWPKNLLVLAAPLAGSTLGRQGRGALDLTIAVLAFTCASAGVYLVNDVLDMERDRGHPGKRLRPVACGELGRSQALALGALCVLAAEAAGPLRLGVWFTVTITAYLATSLLYSLGLKHLPVIELALVASGFVLRALGGAAAARIPPSGWFILVCSLGALLVVIAKREKELAALGRPAAVQHRPCLRWYSTSGLLLGGRLVAAAMLTAYLFWALGEPDPWTRTWRLVTLVPLAGALLRFDRLTTRAGTSRVEDLLTRDRVMLVLEALWLLLFVLGMWL
ncbi:decaprenyl-phosphate phosphoribosyltransferase [Streptacidiphilus sp. MAP12-16]|uniref:decaprenyl-phosphate phosphoribosyltransferase n=1 Tax=Streptacidiphilus sp. MAP12-16 TaxID=3156300 RepID=UPI0035186466